MKTIIKLINFNLNILIMFCAFSSIYPQDIYNKNLLVNGNAELGNQTYTPGWVNTYTNEPTAENFGHTGGEYDWDWGKDKGYDDYYFRAAVTKTEPRFISQEFDVTSITSDIESGIVSYELKGDFGGAEGLSSRIEAVFKNKDGKIIGKESTLKLNPSEQNLLFYSKTKSGTVPKGTSSIEVKLHFEYIGECPNCTHVAVADNLSFILKK